MRTEKSIKNLFFSLIGQTFAILISFVSRYFFVRLLATEYLGLNGLFTNILTILSFVELGIGPALTFALYEPLKNKDKEKIKSLMYVFKKSYIYIGTIIIILGILLTPFIKLLISDLPSIKNLHLIYILFVINSGVSYFGSYKKTLLTSDQKGYKVSMMHYICFFLMNVFQILVLFFTKNFILYLIIQIIFTILENVVSSIFVNKEYCYIKENAKPLDMKTKSILKKNILAMIIHKFGSIIVTATDNLLLSKYIGLTAVAIYSNYYLIINNVHKVLKQLFNSVIASVGNLGAEHNNNKLLNVFNNINFVNILLHSIISIYLLVLFQDFIQIWVGKNFLFDYKIVIVLVLCFYFTGLRNSVLLFKDALGLYWQDRFKAFFEAIINLIVSILLVLKFGVIGVFLGTLISTLTTCFWIEPYVLYKHGFKKSSISYFSRVLKSTLVSIFIFLVTIYICNFIKFSPLINLILKFFVCSLIMFFTYFILYKDNEEIKYFKNIVNNIRRRVLK